MFAGPAGLGHVGAEAAVDCPAAVAAVAFEADTGPRGTHVSTAVHASTMHARELLRCARQHGGGWNSAPPPMVLPLLRCLPSFFFMMTR